ncbi:hypothetical protein CHS0354_004527 [Potamilus streckersoni]|uniref:EF-hand domain-containing protein n=1 Tax=Potamilus streckersoni TaxID=2493646 RepID=A0AAE0VPW8_9BIVA|nr:hypothetical protein CHS0354_004527 [Potamilus streckersoni]
MFDRILSVLALSLLANISMLTVDASILKQVIKASQKSLMPLRQTEFKRSTEESNSDNEPCFSVSHLKALKEQFQNYIDKDHDGKASFDEMYAYLLKYSPSVTKETVEEFLAKRDKDGDGSVDFIPDYLLEISAPDYDTATAMEWFQLEDLNNDGFVSKDELIKIAMNVGMPRQEAEQTAMGYYMSADQNGDSRLSWEEYLPLYTQ